MNGTGPNPVNQITNTVADRVLTVGDVSDENCDLNGEANLTFDGSTLTVAGNLTVTGTTTTISTTNTVVADRLLELANGASTGADSGIIIERGSTGNNAAILWDESRDEFVLATTTATGASTGDLSFTPANVSVERIGAGTEQAEAEVHAKRDASSGGTYSSNAPIIIEDDARPALQFVGSANNIALIEFGDNAAAASGQLYYDHSTDKLRVDCGGNTDRLTVDASGNAVTAGTVTATGFTIGSAVIGEAELEILDGATLTTTELNYVDGVTSSIQTQLDSKGATAGSNSLTTVGTISSGTWQGTAIASAYLDADTAHLSGTQTFTGAKTFSADVVISGTTPALTIGDGGTEDTMLVFDGNAADFRIGIDDGTDTLEIGKGTAHGTTPVIKIDSATNCQVLHNSAVADGEYSGDLAMFQAGEDLTAGELVYFKSDGKCWKAVATAAATSRCVAMCVATVSADATGPFLLKGFARFNSEFPTWTVGGVLYTPEAETSGKNVPEQTAPDTDGDFVQIVGWAVSADAVWFDPDSTVVEVA